MFFRCTNCFESAKVIYGLEKECKICYENNTTIIYSKCGHTICAQCRHNTDNYKCPFCNKCENSKISMNAIHVSHDNYFSTVVPELRSLFKEFYYQIIDNVSRKQFYYTVYELCAEYCKFLKLLHLNNNNHNPNKLGVPSRINEIWQLHFQNKESYKLACELICGYELDYIYTKTGNEFNLTEKLYMQVYGLNSCATEFAIWCELGLYDPLAETIYFKTLSGRTITILISMQESIKKLKFLIYRKEGIPISNEFNISWKRPT